MDETITRYAQTRWRSDAWWSTASEQDRADLDSGVHRHFIGAVDTRTDVLLTQVEVSILAGLAAHNARPISIGWLEREYDEVRGDWVTAPRETYGAVVVYLDNKCLVICTPSSQVLTIALDVVYDLHVLDRVKTRAKPDEAQAVLA